MEDFLPLGIIIGVCVLVLLLWLWRHTEREVRELSQSVKRLRQDIEIAEAKVQQAQFIDLDLSSIETKVEEDKQDLVVLVREEVESLSRDLDDVDERLEALETDRENVSDERITELEERVAELEERLERPIETKQS